MSWLRYHLALALMKLSARVYPLSTPSVGFGTHVGERWLDWRIRQEGKARS